MAKRTNEAPYRPLRHLDASLVQSVLAGHDSQSPVARQGVPDSPAALVEPAQSRQPHEAPVSSPVSAAAVPRRRGPVPELAHHTFERMDREKRVLLSRSEERALERVVANIASEIGASLKLSHVLRSCVRIVINAEQELVERARTTGRLIRPPNGDLPALEAFERSITAVVHAGIRASRPPR